MSKKKVLLGLTVLVSVALLATAITSKDLKISKKLCCIAGNYQGSYQDTASLTCTSPNKGTFTMVLNQESKCGQKIWGTITSEDGTVQKFSGTVSSAANGCCKIQLKVFMPMKPLTQTKPAVQLSSEKPTVMSLKKPETTEVEGIICRKKGKWTVENGTYKSSEGCSGVWSMTQL